ncbi:MAG: helix-turn-helix domain-containing protein [Nitrososphaerales archaeon]
MVREDWCSVTATSEIISTKWRPVIIDRLLERPRRFNELKRTIQHISSKVLVDNLTKLEEEGILERIVDTNPPISVQYRLTEKGRDLKEVMDAMEQWGEKWLTKEIEM